MQHRKDKDAKGTFITYRPEIKVLDCTIRDGGLINNHLFEDKFIKTVHDTLVAAGVDYMEVGYKGSTDVFARSEYGAWKFCCEDEIRRAIGDEPGIKLSVMADTGRTDYHTDILPKEQSVISLIRVATYIHQIPAAIEIIKDAHDKGYETTVNLMAVSTVQERELGEALEVLAKTPVGAIYVVDSFGSMYSEQIRDLTLNYLEAIKDSDKLVGVHAHNNQQLAYANTLEALIVGANMLDATIMGMGRGAGNCPLELLIGFLRNPRYKLRPVLECIEKTFVPMRQEMDWGFSIPYMITGLLNEHPRSAIKVRESDKPDEYVAFFDEMSAKE